MKQFLITLFKFLGLIVLMLLSPVLVPLALMGMMLQGLWALASGKPGGYPYE